MLKRIQEAWTNLSFRKKRTTKKAPAKKAAAKPEWAIPNAETFFAEAKNFVALARAIERREDIVKLRIRAEQKDIANKRFTETPAFKALDALVEVAEKQRLSPGRGIGFSKFEKTLNAISDSIIRMKDKVLADPRAAVFRAHIEDAAKDGIRYGGPKLDDAIKTPYDEAKIFRNTYGAASGLAAELERFQGYVGRQVSRVGSASKLKTQPPRP